MYVEYKRRKEDPDWLLGDVFVKDERDQNKMEMVAIYGDRWYALFNLLAGVRGHDESLEPISYPKGLPKDVNPYIKKESDDWDTDGHSHSWLTLGELKRYKVEDPDLEEGLNSLISDLQKRAEMIMYYGIPTNKGEFDDAIRIVFWFDN